MSELTNSSALARTAEAESPLQELSLGSDLAESIAEADYDPFHPFLPILGDVNKHYKLPFQPRHKQYLAIRELASSDRAGWYADPGTGKTLMSTVMALHSKLQEPGLVVVVMMPFPILVPGWVSWLRSIGGVGKVVDYRGTPKQRRAMDLSDADFIVLTTHIFRSDFASAGVDPIAGRPRMGIVDEAHCVKNPTSLTYRAVRDYFPESQLLLLTGTPLSSPGDAFAYTKLLSPPIYRSHTQFENIHVGERDFFGKVTQWVNLPLMRANFLNNGLRLLKEQMLVGLKEPVYKLIEYDLDPAHMRLYEELMSTQLLQLENGGKIDATTAQTLYHAAQQIIVNYDYFSGDPNKESVAVDVVRSVLDEIGIGEGTHKKLIVFGEYKMTNRKLRQVLQPYGAVACFSEISRKEQDWAIERFLTDPTCQVMVANPGSAGFGWNPQKVCSDVLFIEEPTIPAKFVQAVGRIYRDGQENTPIVRIAIANGTIQRHLHKRLLNNDELINKVQGAYEDLRDAIHGRG